ncbi:MAG: hypothetical protein JWO90_205 [Solirubrobacterales bacterium]|jgi:hypothetical protein|nr:hypothetical protein [Solirubrobacterales bacterium]
MGAARGRTSRRSAAAQQRRSQLVGAVGVLLAAVVPAYLWHDVVADIAAASSGGLDTATLVGWAPWVLMALGLLCAVPILVEHLRDRDRRFHRPGTGAWVGWGVSLYLMGFGLATQVAQIHGLHS